MSSNIHPADVDNPFFLSENEADDNRESDAESSTSLEAPKPVDPQEQLLGDLESQLNSLTLDAQSIIARQPRATQVQLETETKHLFNDYQHCGSMARLKVGVEKFLCLGNNGGRMRFENPKDDKAPTAFLRRPEQTDKPTHYGAAFMMNYTEDDDAYAYEDKASSATGCISDRSLLASGPPIHSLRIVDPDSISYITTLPWDPIATKITWPAHVAWPPGLLGKLNQILSIVDHEARVRLFHHVSKYGPSPLFRVGISEQIRSHYSSIFESAEDNYLGLTPESRSFIRGVYESQKTLNTAEKRLLGFTCRIAADSVEEFWDDLTFSRKGHTAMRIFMVAREVERAQEARRLELDRKRAKAAREYQCRMQASLRSGQVGTRSESSDF